MKKIKNLKSWGIFELNAKEILEYGFHFAVIHPNDMDCGLLSPSDTDMEMESLDDCIAWILKYDYIKNY
jgi:hypothetical protein